MKTIEIVGSVASAGDPGHTVVTVEIKETLAGGIVRRSDRLEIAIDEFVAVEDVSREIVQAKLRKAGVIHAADKVMTMSEARAARQARKKS